GRSGRRRIRDHRGEARLGRELAADDCPPRELAHAGALLDEFDLEVEQHARLDRRTELRALDRHEIDELAGAGEAERFDREYAGCLRQRLDDQHARHDRPAREMALEETLVDRHRLGGDDPFADDELLDAIDEEHRIAVRQRRHHPPDVERADGGLLRLPHQRPCGRGRCCCCCCAGCCCCCCWPLCWGGGGATTLSGVV